MWVFVLGCSNSGLDLGSTTGDSAGGVAIGIENCPWVGEWEQDTISCGNFAFDDDWDAAGYDGATMEISHHPEGGCAVVTTIRGDDCRREEGWRFALPVGIDVALTSDGITDCIPNACQFDLASDPCSNGELAGEFAVRIDDQGDRFEAIGLLADTAQPACPLDVNTTWNKE